MDVTIWSSIVGANQQHPTINVTLFSKLPFDLVVWVIAQPSRRAKSSTILPKKKGCSVGIILVHMIDNHSFEEITYQCWVVLTG
jgi:hypothetical protein